MQQVLQQMLSLTRPALTLSAGKGLDGIAAAANVATTTHAVDGAVAVAGLAVLGVPHAAVLQAAKLAMG
jgi:hypothetical protein